MLERYPAKFYETIEDMATSTSPQAGQYAIACALIELAEEMHILGSSLAETMQNSDFGNGAVASSLSRVADVLSDFTPHTANPGDDQ